MQWLKPVNCLHCVFTVVQNEQALLLLWFVYRIEYISLYCCSDIQRFLLILIYNITFPITLMKRQDAIFITIQNHAV